MCIRGALFKKTVLLVLNLTIGINQRMVFFDKYQNTSSFVKVPLL